MTNEQRLLKAIEPFTQLVHDDGIELPDMQHHPAHWNLALAELAAAAKHYKVRCSALLNERDEQKQCGRRATARVRRRSSTEQATVVVPVCGRCAEKFVSAGWESV